MVVLSIDARACLADPGSEVNRAREQAESGDLDWREWVQEFDRGQATLIDMRVTAEIELDDRSVERIVVSNHQIWMHLAQHPPIVASLVADIATKDLDELTVRIRDLGEPITVSELERMYVTVELAENLRDALCPTAADGAEGALGGARLGLETENA